MLHMMFFARKQNIFKLVVTLSDNRVATSQKALRTVIAAAHGVEDTETRLAGIDPDILTISRSPDALIRYNDKCHQHGKKINIIRHKTHGVATTKTILLIIGG
jgi:hypothetical protein